MSLKYQYSYTGDNVMTQDKNVDESWKQSAAKEKEQAAGAYKQQNKDAHEFDFRAYITSLSMQALIFLGVVPNPMNGDKIEKNMDQARLLIDTLSILREKTAGNLTKEEEDLLNTMLYELQVKFVEHSQTGDSKIVTA